MLARKRSQPIKCRVRERQPITERLQSISLKSCLSKEKKESLFIRARSVWIELEEWAETGKVVRALILTLQYCPLRTVFIH